jgi:hypothetical protein
MVDGRRGGVTARVAAGCYRGGRGRPGYLSGSPAREGVRWEGRGVAGPRAGGSASPLPADLYVAAFHGSSDLVAVVRLSGGAFRPGGRGCGPAGATSWWSAPRPPWWSARGSATRSWQRGT